MIWLSENRKASKGWKSTSEPRLHYCTPWFNGGLLGEKLSGNRTKSHLAVQASLLHQQSLNQTDSSQFWIIKLQQDKENCFRWLSVCCDRGMDQRKPWVSLTHHGLVDVVLQGVDEQVAHRLPGSFGLLCLGQPQVQLVHGALQLLKALQGLVHLTLPATYVSF